MSMILGDEAAALSPMQKANAAGRAIPTARTHHPYVVGLILIVVGCVGLVGSITGNLPAMLGALFDPNAIMDTSGNAAGPNITSKSLTSAQGNQLSNTIGLIGPGLATITGTKGK